MAINLGKARTLFDSNGVVLGRIVPLRSGEGVAIAFVPKTAGEGPTVRKYGPQELLMKTELNGWTNEESFLTVQKVAFNASDRTVSVTLVHNLFSGWNQYITVPLADGWQSAVTTELMARSRAHGSETHISNFGELVV
jgi:hypothetical protein